PAIVGTAWGSSDTSIMTLADAGSGIYGPTFNAVGLYVVYVLTELEVGANPATPAAAAESDLSGIFGYLFGSPNETPFAANVSLSGNWFADTSASTVYNIGTVPQGA